MKKNVNPFFLISKCTKCPATTYFCFSLLLIFTNVTAQNFPYLNASTGNAGEYVVDVDSNVYIFKGSVIKKIDKNFNPIWIKNYSDLNFKNLLLSKTGSLYFISGSAELDVIGKIDAIGNLTWCKSLPTYTAIVGSAPITITLEFANQILLDRNNNLIITGKGPGDDVTPWGMYFLKLDTLGNFMKLRSVVNNTMTNPNESVVINDINGLYTVSSWGYGYGGGSSYALYNLIYEYSEATDSIISGPVYQIGYTNANYSVSNQRIIKSKNNPDVFYSTISNSFYNSSLHNTFNLRKIKDTTLLWQIKFETFSPYSMGVLNIEEDQLKNTYALFSSDNINTDKCEAWTIKIDSNGICDNKRYNLIQYHRTMAYRDTIAHLLHHYSNNYFCTIEPSSFQSSPLTIIKMDSTLGSYCTTSASIAAISANDWTKSPNPFVVTTVAVVPSVTMATVLSTVTTVSSFSVTVNSCLPLNTKEFEVNYGITIYPNPASNVLHINSSNDFSIMDSIIFDVTGKIILSINNQKTIDVSKLNTGIYFIKVITDKGEYKQKFIIE